MNLLSLIIDYGAPIFLITSPLTSYADQIISIHRSRTSAGFSLDIPLIMLVASILKVFYWFGEYYSKALLGQALVMILVQMGLLKVALDNRPSPSARNEVEHTPFNGTGGSDSGPTRPYDFWQWKNTKPYWLFLAYFTVFLAIIHLTPISDSDFYINLLGYIGLAVEATLPVPQILANHRSGSCKGFRLSVLGAWVIGDTMKITYFFASKEAIPWAFKLCGIFQCACDFYLAVQFWMYTRGSHRPASPTPSSSDEQEDRWGQEAKDIRMT
ncbi:hypothetical protein NUU61_001983 [Penicillium alfredii]|uniref:PQ loop repeat protein n=1 Tax=Penicillium alfredii TaxID=1506179 RepID=A0A9W9FQN7_9EURO|nr:uncharacterized protein NUU61_001983 [Penicillium alfredii]KAJ5104636.1 hypothetical protein NUU61_001983 [Penicillium alfredii]